MTLNIENIGKRICKIDGGQYNNKILSVNTDADDENLIQKPFTKYKISDSGIFQQIPDAKDEKKREILYITGQSGSGKTTYLTKYLKCWKKQYKSNDIYLFSLLKEDKQIDNLDVIRIPLDEELINNPIDFDDIEEYSMLVFDDIDVISDKKIKEAVYDVLNKVLEIGRHKSLFCIITNHLPISKDIKRVLNECTAITYFPQSTTRSVIYLLENYIGLDKAQIKLIKKTKSRWATIYKNYPQICMTEKNIWLPNDD